MIAGDDCDRKTSDRGAFVILGLGRRRLLWIGVTTNPTAEWLARQITEVARCLQDQKNVITPPAGNPISAYASAALLAAIVAFPGAAQSQQSQPVQQPDDAIWTFDDWRPTVTSPDGRFTMSLRARLQVDAGVFGQSDDIDTVTPERNAQFKDLRPGVITRRFYLGVEGRAFGNFWYEYRMDFGGTRFAIAKPIVNLARISYSFGGAGGPTESPFRINAGLIKPIFTFEDATSSAALTYLERADVVNVVTSTYGGGIPRVGVELTFHEMGLFRPGDFLVVSGAFTGQNSSGNNAALPDAIRREGTQVLGRIAYRLWSDGLSSIQVGGSASDLLTVAENGVGGTHTVTLREQPEIRVDGSRLVSTGAIPEKGGALWGLEMAANVRNVYFSSEYYQFGVNRDTSCGGCIVAADPSFSGWYVQSSWILTGETKIYQSNVNNNNMATFYNPRVTAPFSLDGQHWGVWEIAIRYSDLNLNWHAGAVGTACVGAAVGCIRGGEQKIVTLGLNWYLTNNIRMMLDYMLIDVNKLNDAGQQVGQDFNAAGIRLQFTN